MLILRVREKGWRGWGEHGGDFFITKVVVGCDCYVFYVE